MSPDARELAATAPVPAVAGNVLLGTAGWTDPSLIKSKRFYPKGTRSSAARLAFYATHFQLVEVDATYYAIPAPAVAQKWVEGTPDSFTFDIKAHPVFTGHPMDRRRLPKDIAEAAKNIGSRPNRLYSNELPFELRKELEDRFLATLAPISDSGKLGCVMVQLPPWETATRGAVRRLERLPDRLPDVRIAVEFRHPTWLESSRRERVLDVLRLNDLTYVAVDEPDVPGGGVPPVLVATTDQLAVIRFHGHNVQGWRPGASVTERFDYLYTPERLASWVQPVRRLANEAQQVHAVFNNCVQDFAIINAKDLSAMLAPFPKSMKKD